MRRYDAVVVGLGAMGSAAAGALARRRLAVLGVEQFAPVHDRGSSHGASRIVRMAYFEHPDYVPLLRLAYDGWARLEEATGRSLITWTGALMIGRPDGDVVAGTLASAAQWRLAHELLDRRAMATSFPQFRLTDDEVAVLERNAGVVHADAAVRAQLAAAAGHGAELRFHTPVHGWDVLGDGVEVDVGGERVVAERLVVTAGPWAGRLLGDAVAVEPVRTVTYHYAATAGFRPDELPAFVWERDRGDSVYGLAEPSVSTCKFGFYDGHSAVDPDNVQRDVADTEIAAMDALLAERLPTLPGPCRSTTVCLYTMTADAHFLIGTVAGTEGRVVLAAGFSGHGFKFAPAIGDVLAELAVDGVATSPLGLFDPARAAAR